MFDISIVELVIIAFVIFITIFAVIDRICKCVEAVNNARAVSMINNPDMIETLTDLARQKSTR